MLETARTIVREAAVFAPYGLFPTLASVIPFVGLQQSTYDVVKAKAMDKNGFGMRPSAVLFLSCGAVAAMVAQSVVYPLDVIRRRVQMKTFKPAIDSSPGVSVLSLARGSSCRDLSVSTAASADYMPASFLHFEMRSCRLSFSSLPRRRPWQA